MLDGCTSDFLLVAMAAGAVISLGVFIVARIIKW
jgi:hypothetical protein